MKQLTERMFDSRKGWMKDQDKCTAKYTFQTTWQTITLYHNFATPQGRKVNRFCLWGLNNYDKMEIKDTNTLLSAARLFGYNQEAMQELEELCKQ